MSYGCNTHGRCKKLIVSLRGREVLIDADVAKLYGVETKRINEAVKNNLERFPEGYILQLSPDEKKELVENFDQFENLKHSPVNPKAFTEKGRVTMFGSVAAIHDRGEIEQQRLTISTV